MNFLLEAFKNNMKRLRHKKLKPESHFKVGDKLKFITSKEAVKRGYKVSYFKDMCEEYKDKIFIVKSIYYDLSNGSVGELTQRLRFENNHGEETLNDSEFYLLSRKQKIQNLLQHI